MDRLAERITGFYVMKNYIPADKQEIYCYGFKLIISDIVNFSIVMILGVLFGKFLGAIAFLMTLCTIRIFSGGFHAKTFFVCRISMLLTFLCVITATELILKLPGHIYISAGLNIVSVVMIAIFSPVKHPNKELSEIQIRQNRIRAFMTSVIAALISVFMEIKGCYEGVTISITLVAIVVFMFIGIAVQKGGKESVRLDK